MASHLSWPDIPFPQKPLSRGFLEQVADGRIRTEMSAGPPKVRRRFTADIKNYRMQFRLTSAQMTTFMTFFDSTLGGGVSAFNFTHPRTGSVISLRFVDRPSYKSENNDNYLLDCRFEELP